MINEQELFVAIRLQRVLAFGCCVIAISCGGEGRPIVTDPPQNSAPARVVITPQELSLRAGGTGGLSAVVVDSSGDTLQHTVDWRSTHEAIATVGGDGRVSARSMGVAGIIAVANSVADTAYIFVYPIDPVPFIVKPATITIAVGDTLGLEVVGEPTDFPVSWEAAVAGIVSVSASNTLRAVGVGSTALVARAASGRTAQIAVTVR